MFPEGVRFMQDTNEVINMSLEEKGDEVLRSFERPKRENTGAGIIDW